MKIQHQAPDKKQPEAALLYDRGNDFFAPENLLTLRDLLSVREEILTLDYLAENNLSNIEVMISGWGAPALTPDILDHFPSLKAVFHLGGSVKQLVGNGEVFRRGVRVSSTNPALAQSVAEFCLAQIILASKHTSENIRQVRMLRTYPSVRASPDHYPMIIGLVGYGAIAKSLRNLLRLLPHRVVVYDPYVSEEMENRDSIDLVNLETLFKTSDIVSCHLPHTPETEGMLRGSHFTSMRKHATFLNTARGQVLNEAELIEVLRQRPDLQAILDVVAEEPVAENHPLHNMENVILTPHIAGCMGPECRRLGAFLVEEVGRWLRDEPLAGEVKAETLSFQA
jgi:phosphoglycerate dehydrogenase-like enzyme